NAGLSGAPAARPASGVRSDAGAGTTTTSADNDVLPVSDQDRTDKHYAASPCARERMTIFHPQSTSKATTLQPFRSVSATPTDAVQLDTTKAGEHKIDYVVTDQAGNKASASRTIIVSAANDAATSTPVAANDNPLPLAP